MSNKKLKIYLAGAMECAKDLGAGWRDKISKYLNDKYKVDIYNPVEFEPQQLEGLRPSRLPESFISRDGKTVKPKHWHEMKLAPRDSCHYRRNKKYGRRIIHYDMRTVAKMDYLIVYWTKATADGAGTHSECTEAFLNNIPVYMVVEKGINPPGWAEWTTTEVFDNDNFDALYSFLEEELGN